MVTMRFRKLAGGIPDGPAESTSAWLLLVEQVVHAILKKHLRGFVRTKKTPEVQ